MLWEVFLKSVDRKREWNYLFLIVVTFIAACIETDIYLPAFPDMMVWFSASESAIQSLLTWNFVGICISGPLYGPLSDSFGRKKPLMVALGLFLAGSLVTVFAKNFDQMLLGRVLQGLGSGGCFTLGTAILFDVFQKEKAIRAINHLFTIIPVIMSGAPMLGGYLNQRYGFRSNFLAIAVFVMLSFIVCLFFFEESLPKEKRVPLQVKATLKDFRQVLCSVPFWQLTCVTSLLFAGYIAFLSGTSVLFVVEFGMSKTIFPFVQGAVLAGWVAGSLVLNRCIARWGVVNIKKSGSFLSGLGGVVLIVATLIAPKNPYLLTSGMVIYAFGANWVTGLYFPEGMEIFPSIKGICSSLLTSARLLIASLVVGLTSALYNGTIYPLAIVVFATIVAIVPILILYEKTKAAKEPAPEGFHV